MAVSEMVSSKSDLQQHKRTLLKADHSGEAGIRSIQIVGTDPLEMANAARLNVDRGAQIIDINMGCPAKKVCSVAAGSALLKNEPLVKMILDAVVNAVDAPVTLKIRTGWDIDNKNAVHIAKIAENSGIAALTIHGRTRACKFNGKAEYETIKQVKQAISIPVIANGDITTAEKAQFVLAKTGADAIMIGRGAQGNPWLFNDIKYFFKYGNHKQKQSLKDTEQTVVKHLCQLYSFYGNTSGVRIARKHIAWYFGFIGTLPEELKSKINRAQLPTEQLSLVNSAFSFFSNRCAA